MLERVKAGRRAEGEYPFLMDEANVDAMFSLLDVLGQGYIRPAQYREGASTGTPAHTKLPACTELLK